ncbi:MAG: proline racemase [Planctomycetes bacterium]|nr:proline racemase [Planctomycetota bacterium]
MPFEPPDHWRRISTIDAHIAGEPLRVITGGYPELEGDTILAMRRYAREHQDGLRRALMLEPRGHADMYGCILTPPVTPDGDVGVLFLHHEGYSTMCGHGIIGLVKVGLDCGLLDAEGEEPEIRIDTPAGRVTATAWRPEGTVRRVSFLNVPSFLVEAEAVVEVPGLGRVGFDLAYGGAFYAYVDASAVGIEIAAEQFATIIDVAMRIKHAVMDSFPLRHPTGDDDLNFLYGVILCAPGDYPIHSRNVCVFADGEVDRSPTGTGVSGRAAILHAKGELGKGPAITIESIIGTHFDVSVVEETEVGGVPAVVPCVTGAAWITGRHEFLIDPEDPLVEGVLLR